MEGQNKTNEVIFSRKNIRLVKLFILYLLDYGHQL